MEIDDELIRKLIAARHAKLEEEKTTKEEEEAEKRKKIAKDEEEKKAEEHKEALEKREAAERSFREVMAKLMGDKFFIDFFFPKPSNIIIKRFLLDLFP
ncbi:hypothetical protein ES703_112326 [subsurface metagenome]